MPQGKDTSWVSWVPVTFAVFLQLIGLVWFSASLNAEVKYLEDRVSAVEVVSREVVHEQVDFGLQLTQIAGDVRYNKALLTDVKEYLRASED